MRSETLSLSLPPASAWSVCLAGAPA